MSAFKAQQFRWAKGSIQVAKKLLPRILRSNATFAQKSEAFFHLCKQRALPAVAAAVAAAAAEPGLRTKHGISEVLTHRPAALLRHHHEHRVVLHDVRAGDRLLRAARRIAWSALKRLPLVLSLGIGLCVNQTRAVLEALLGAETEFVRTPKHGIRGQARVVVRARSTARPLAHAARGGGAGRLLPGGDGGRLQHHHFLSMPFLALFLCGFGYVGGSSLWQGRSGAPCAPAFAGRMAVAWCMVAAPVFPSLSASMRAGAPRPESGRGLVTAGPTVSWCPARFARGAAV
jgi:hypothetical protein